MEEKKVLILRREDLINGNETKAISELCLIDFKSPKKQVEEFGIILFIDDNQNTRLLKNRYVNKYFYGFDAIKGVVWRYGQNGVTRLSDIGILTK